MKKNLKKAISLILGMALSISCLTAFAEETDNTDTGANTNITNTNNGEDSGTNSDDKDDDFVISIGEKVLTKDVDYILTYRNNVDVGVATVVVTFIGNYAGEMEREFNIIKKASSGGGGGGGGGSIRSSFNVKVEDKDGKPVIVTKKEKGDTVTLTLPNNKEIIEGEPYTITVKDTKGVLKPEITVILIDKNGKEVSGKTDKNGQVKLPSETPTATETPIPTDIPVIFEKGDNHKAYISGYDDGTFKPDGNITRAETASMLDRVVVKNYKNDILTFSDLVPNAWYISAIQNMSAAGMVNGYTDGTFRPDNAITRAEFVTMLVLKGDVMKYENIPFSDVYDGLWSADYIYTAYKLGYIDGYDDGTFRPDSPITRAEAVKIINSCLERTDLSITDNPFSDVRDSHWAYKQILEASVSHKINSDN